MRPLKNSINRRGERSRTTIFGQIHASTSLSVTDDLIFQKSHNNYERRNDNLRAETLRLLQMANTVLIVFRFLEALTTFPKRKVSKPECPYGIDVWNF